MVVQARRVKEIMAAVTADLQARHIQRAAAAELAVRAETQRLVAPPELVAQEPRHLYLGLLWVTQAAVAAAYITEAQEAAHQAEAAQALILVTELPEPQIEVAAAAVLVMVLLAVQAALVSSFFLIQLTKAQPLRLHLPRK